VSSPDADDVIERVVRELERPVAFDSAIDARNMRAVEQAASGGRSAWYARAWEWLWQPQLIRVNPLGALALAAGVVTMMVVSTSTLRHPGVRPAPGSRGTEFVLVAPAASHVALVGDFNDWNASATPLTEVKSGLWRVTVPLPPGRYEYTFVVDGTKWVPDPAAPKSIDDDFGKKNSVVTIAESSS
jgi:hypothetical protein